MSDAEHLVENIYFCVKRDGSENISKETLRWLFAMASYVIYQDKIWGG